MFFIDEHPQKAFCSIDKTEKSFTHSNDEQFKKDSSHIDFTDDGIFISKSEEHSLNVPFLITFNEDRIEIFSNDEHSANEYLPIEFTDFGICIRCKDFHFANAFSLIDVTDERIVISVIEHSANELFPIISKVIKISKNTCANDEQYLTDDGIRIFFNDLHS